MSLLYVKLIIFLVTILNSLQMPVFQLDDEGGQEEFDEPKIGGVLLLNRTYHNKSRKFASEECTTYNLTFSSELRECSPGSMYIVRCQQCICPYMGSITYFCRPMPANIYCEQAYPGFNFMPNAGGRRQKKPEDNPIDVTNSVPTSARHEHTMYQCIQPGNVADKCFICQCEEDRTLIEEHCFKSNATDCATALPSFLNKL